MFGAEVEKERGAQAAEGLSAAWIRKVWTGKVREVPNVGFLKGQKEALDLVHPVTMCVYIEYIYMYIIYTYIIYLSIYLMSKTTMRIIIT